MCEKSNCPFFSKKNLLTQWEIKEEKQDRTFYKKKDLLTKKVTEEEKPVIVTEILMGKSLIKNLLT